MAHLNRHRGYEGNDISFLTRIMWTEHWRQQALGTKSIAR